MHNNFARTKARVIFEILLIPLLISLTGIYVVISNNDTKAYSLQLHFAIATVVVASVPFIKFSVIRSYSYIPYIITIIFLGLVLIAGQMAGGATRWISLSGFRFQPSELLKLVLPLVLIHYYQSKKLPLSNQKILVSIPIIALPIFLVLIQPDLGTSIVILLTAIFVPFMLGLKKRTIRITILLLLIMLPVLWTLLFPYQQMRVLAYLWPSDYSLSSYQVRQSICAIREGGLWGVSSTKFPVPSGTTDFVFAVFANKFGFMGVMCLMVLFNRLVKNIVFLAKHNRNPLVSALAGSYAFLITCSFMINVFMVTGMLPVVGLPMPLMSYGGTAFLINIVIIMILVVAFKKNTLPTHTNIGIEFKKKQHHRLKLLTRYLDIAHLTILLRVIYIYVMD